MRVSDSNLISEVEDVYILDSGIFYFCTNYIISEIKEGITFDWQTAVQVIDLAYAHYGQDAKISYISNRIHSYSLVPQDWLKFFSARHTLLSFAVVTYTKAGLMNVVLEKMFFKSKIKRFENLYEATEWVKQHAPTRKAEAV